MVLEKYNVNIQSIMWIFLKIFSSLFPLHGNILCIFLVFVGIFLWHVKFKYMTVLVVCDDLRARARWTLPLDGVALFAIPYIAFHCYPPLLKLCNYIW
jgi:hypothetical protein